MNGNFFVYLGFLLVLILDLLTVAARSGLRDSNLARVLQLREHKGEDNTRVQNIMNSSTRPIAGVHYLQTTCRFLLVGLFFYFFPWGDGSVWMGWYIGILVLGGMIIALLEWVVDQAVARDPEIWVSRLGVFIQVLSFIFYPLVLVGTWLSRDTNDEQNTVSEFEEDLKLMVEAGQQEGVLEQEESQMIFSIFQLDDTLTREIMVPRIEMLAFDINTPLADALDNFLESGYSRVPVYEGRMDNIIGILYAKDLLKIQRDANGHEVNIRGQLREPYFVPEAKKVDELLAEMQHRRVHMAIVVDEYGGVAGVVTLEDIIEEILGEIQDEYDVEDMPFQVLDDGSYLFRGRIDLDDFNQIMETNLPPEEADTLSGFIYGRLGHVPVAGETLKAEGLVLSVDQVSNRRIRTVRARRSLPKG